jgi:truncated hemoglobin YjbI
MPASISEHFVEELVAIFYRLIRDSPNLERQLYPQALGSFFVASYNS